MNLDSTNLIVERGVLDIFRDSGHSLNILLTFFITLRVDAIVEHVSLILYLPQSAKEDQGIVGLNLPRPRTQTTSPIARAR